MNVSKFSMEIGNALGLSGEDKETLRLCAGIHDVGKFQIPVEILNKNGTLTKEEWDVMKRHPEIGAIKITKKRYEDIIIKTVLHHHERWDGGGYPYGLKKLEIPIFSRIIFIADAFDVMISKRSYKEPISNEMAISEIKKCAGTQFDPEYVKAFLSIMNQKSIAI